MYKRVDKNQNNIVEELRNLGFSVEIISKLGKGKPDLLVGINNITLLVEVKMEANEKNLTKDEKVFKSKWKGSYLIADNVMQICDWFLKYKRERY